MCALQLTPQVASAPSPDFGQTLVPSGLLFSGPPPSIHMGRCAMDIRLPVGAPHEAESGAMFLPTRFSMSCVRLGLLLLLESDHLFLRQSVASLPQWW